MIATQQPHTGIGVQLAPHAAVGLLVVAAAATHAVASATGHEAATAASVGATAFVLAVLVAMKRGQKISCPKSRSRLAAFLLAAAGWLTSVTATGLSWGAVEVLALMVSVISLNWWRTHRIKDAVVERAAAPTEYAERWERNVGAPSRAVPGSRLVDPEVIGSGVRYTLRLVPGVQEQSTVTGAMERIRGGLSLRDGQELIIERHTTLPEPHQLLTIVTTSPIKQEILWPGPSAFDSATGTVALGPFADGIGVARWRVYSKSRLYGGYMQGGTDSGKSRTGDSIMVSIAASVSHPTVVQYADGQGGASSPTVLTKYADRVAKTPAETVIMLRDALRVIDLRQDENDIEGWTGFTPTAARPGLLIFMDECHKLLIFPEIQEMVATIAREGGKVGVACILASQSPLLDAFGGSSPKNYAESIRSNLLMGNGLAFRSKSKDVKHIFEISINPSSFPPTPGYAYLVDLLPGGRSAPFRSYHFTDAQAAEYLPTSTWRGLDVGAANAAGRQYLDRFKIQAAAMDVKRARVEARKAGRPVGAAAPTGLAPPLPDVTRFPVWTSTPPANVAAAGPRIAEVHRKVAEAVASGAVTPAGFTMPHLVAKHLGYSERWAGIALKELVALGVLHQPAGAPQGRYYPTGKTLSRKAA
jgi:hypothetical protein